MEPPLAKPEWLDVIESRLKLQPGEKLKDQHLRDLGIDPSRVRRWFKKHHGITFQAYQRSMRLNRAFGTLREGKKVTDAAFATGYESLSGFQEAFRNQHGHSPSQANEATEPILIRRISTPLGPLIAGATAGTLCLLEFADRRMLETQLVRLRKHFQMPLSPGSNAILDQVEMELAEYFSGQRTKFNVPLEVPGTTFQESVWQALQSIPYGTTSSYQKLAEGIHRPKAVRAVASANGDNRISILIPCHRIIGSDGKLRGYGGGLWRKKWLLDMERRNR